MHIPQVRSHAEKVHKAVRRRLPLLVVVPHDDGASVERRSEKVGSILGLEAPPEFLTVRERLQELGEACDRRSKTPVDFGLALRVSVEKQAIGVGYVLPQKLERSAGVVGGAS